MCHYIVLLLSAYNLHEMNKLSGTAKASESSGITGQVRLLVLSDGEAIVLLK